MGFLTAEMRLMLDEQQLGFVATVCPDGTPNLSPKGTTTVWDDDHLVFADIGSPTTIANLRQNSAVEINVVDPLTRKGYRFKGVAVIFNEGMRFEEINEFYRRRGSTTKKQHFVLVKIERVAPLISPVYDLGESESERQIGARWRQYWERLWERRLGPSR